MQKKLLATACALSLCYATGLNAQQDERRYGQGAAFTVEDLPPGQLRSRLESLPPTAKAKALNWLSSFTFPEQDLDSLGVDDEGAVFYFEGELPAPVESQSSGGATIESISAADTFTLHSRPGASKVIYLDFDGEVITGTAWNNSGVTSYDAKAFSQDSDYASFSAAELTAIAEVWHRIAEDFAIFDVDVTTERPITFGPQTGHVLITEDTDKNGAAMPSQGAGGVAYVGPYGWSNYQYYSPALVYANRLGPNYAPFISEAASHEMGHNLGLSHDGTSSLGYYSGHGSGWVSWGPIMGTGYNDNVSQWSKGEYPDANNTQDDISMITDDFGLRGDDHGDSFATATALAVQSDGSVSATTPESDPFNTVPENKGIINSTSDVDTFVFNSGAGTLSLQVTPSWAAYPRSSGGRGTNLDVLVGLYDGNEQLLAEFDPLDDTLAAVNISVNAGTYYLKITGVGNVDSPYSDYGSQGQYFVTGTIPSAVVDTTAPSPDPMSWAQVPAATGADSIAMTGEVAVDDLAGPVQYYFSCTAGDSACTDSGWISSNSYTATGLSAASSYSWQVKARDLSGNETQPSATASATTDTLPPAPMPPAAPSDAVASDLADGTALITWVDNADNESSFEIVRESWHTKRKRWQSATLIATPPADTSSYIDASGTGLYRYHIRAVNSEGASAYADTDPNGVNVTDSASSGGGGGSCKGGPKKCG
jgi:hypothetical protein